MRQDAARADAGEDPERAVRDRRRDRPDRSRLRRRGRREHPPEADPGRRLRRQEGRDRDHLHRRGRQDRAQGRQPFDHARRVGRGRPAGAAQDPRGNGRLGAAAGLAKIIAKRIGKNAVGFGAEIHSKHSQEGSELLAQVMPEDLLSYGLIPEFIGRLPVVSAVHQLLRDDLVKILEEPKNALVKQYQRFFNYDSIELVFTDDALWEIADKALERETGARGLRSIIENALLDVMFELPSRKDVSKCVITKETIEKGLKPTLVTSAGADIEPDELAEESA